MFIRFVVGKDNEDHRQSTGVITEARFSMKEASWKIIKLHGLKKPINGLIRISRVRHFQRIRN
jgi:hypothetical protein